jgi:pyruvate formate lyase activating enzyme
MEGRLPEFEIVLTVFPGNEEEVVAIAESLPRGNLVLQQGVEKRFWREWEEGPSGRKNKAPCGEFTPLAFDELLLLAGRIKKLGRTIRIRTRERGEVLV